MELLQNVAGTLRFPGPGDDPVAFSEAPKVTVTRHSDGSAIVTDKATTEETEDGETYFTLDLTGAQLAEVDLLTATWSDGSSSYTTHAEVVGAFVTSLKAIKKKYSEGAADEDVEAAREVATSDIESACGVAFRPRYGKEILDGSGTKQLLLRQPRLLRVLSVAVAGKELTEEELEELTLDPVGMLVGESSWPEGRANIEVAYVHGFESFAPAELPVRDLAAYLLTESPTDWNERATSIQREDGYSYTLVTPGVRGASFPLPSVNAFVEANSYVSVG